MNQFFCAAAALVVLLLAGCKMDPFLFVPQRTDAYVFETDGGTPEESVAPERIRELRIDVDAQISLGAVYVLGSVQPPRAHVIYFHGAGTHLGHQFWRLKRIANLGYDVLGVDYRGFGTSTDVQPTEAGLDADTRAARAWLLALRPAPERLVYYAHSFGTAIALQRAASNPPDVLLLESPISSVERMKSDTTQMDFPLTFVASDTWNSVERVASIHVPLLIAHGTDDQLIRVEFGQELFAAANEPKELILVDGGQHGDVLPVVQARYADFLERHLGP